MARFAAAMVFGWLLALAMPAAGRRRPQFHFAPVTLDHLFKENLTSAHAEFSGSDDRVCMGGWCWTNDESAALTNILRAYLQPEYGINPMFERRLFQGFFSSLLSKHWSGKVPGDLVSLTDDQTASTGQTRKRRGWFSRRHTAAHRSGKSTRARDEEDSRAGEQYSTQHYLATWALMMSRSHTHVVSRTELLIGAYLAEQWIYDPYPACLTLEAGGGSVGSAHQDRAALGNYTAVSRSDGNRVSYQQRPPLEVKRSPLAAKASFQVAYEEVCDKDGFVFAYVCIRVCELEV